MLFKNLISRKCRKKPFLPIEICTVQEVKPGNNAGVHLSYLYPHSHKLHMYVCKKESMGQ